MTSTQQQSSSSSAGGGAAAAAASAWPPAYATDPDAHLEQLLRHHRLLQPVIDRNAATGGILPATRDAQSHRVLFGLGLNHAGKFCHFHGRVDAGETVPQGAAREAWEESKGALISWMLPTWPPSPPSNSGAAENATPPASASNNNNNCEIESNTNASASVASSSASLAFHFPLIQLWRLVMLPGVFSQHVARGGMHVINLGDTDAAQRALICQRFRETPAWSACADEVTEIHWFDAAEFRSLCLGANRESTASSSTAATTPADHKKVVLSRNATTNKKQPLRGWLADIFCAPEFWGQPVMRAICDEGRVPLLPVAALPVLSDDVLMRLPFKV